MAGEVAKHIHNVYFQNGRKLEVSKLIKDPLSTLSVSSMNHRVEDVNGKNIIIKRKLLGKR